MIRAAAAYPFSDLALARRLERAEASRNAAFVKTRAELQPGLLATWAKVAGTFAMVDGVGSPLTQSFGLGLFQTIGPAEMQALENFFRDRGAEVFHDLAMMGAQPGSTSQRNAERQGFRIVYTRIKWQLRPTGA